jgi:lipoprotein-releasing system permease protein
LFGGLLCLAQQRWGFITMGGPENAFVVTAYPVELHVVDFFVVAAIVISISWLAARLPVRRILGQKFSLK